MVTIRVILEAVTRSILGGLYILFIMVVSIYRKAYDEATVRARPVDHLTSSLNKIEILYIIYIIGYWFKPGSIASV